LAAQDQWDRTARLFGAAEVMREASGVALTAAARAEHQQVIAAARSSLGDEAFAGAWAEGQAMSPEQIIAYALIDSEFDSGRALPSDGPLGD
jgi:hypothetical protein